jgi:hypothetical protein
MVVNQILDDRMIETRLLELAYTTDAKLTAPALAYFAPCSIEDASRVLEKLATHDRLEMEVQEDGSIVYNLRGRERLALRPEHALVPAVQRYPVQSSPLIAAVLALVVPGAGHAYVGRFAAALAWFLVVTLGYLLFFPGILLHLLSAGSAARAAALESGPRLPPPNRQLRAI